MTIRVAINGHGRIRRNILRAHDEAGGKHDLEIIAINDLGDAQTNAHLTRHDTTHGPFHGIVAVDFNHNPASCIFDATLTKVVGGTLVKALAWYDNEWAFPIACSM